MAISSALNHRERQAKAKRWGYRGVRKFFDNRILLGIVWSVRHEALRFRVGFAGWHETAVMIWSVREGRFSTVMSRGAD